jgi:hypothetical protein
VSSSGQRMRRTLHAVLPRHCMWLPSDIEIRAALSHARRGRRSWPEEVRHAVPCKRWPWWQAHAAPALARAGCINGAWSDFVTLLRCAAAPLKGRPKATYLPSVKAAAFRLQQAFPEDCIRRTGPDRRDRTGNTAVGE